MSAKQTRTVAKQVQAVVEAGQSWCRANQHIWQNPAARGNGALRVQSGVVQVRFHCANCDGERHDSISLKSGELLSRQYHMPKGYVLRLGSSGNRPSKSDWRREHYRALLKGGK